VTLAQQSRQAQLQLRARVLRQLLTFWPLLDMEQLDKTFPQWATAVGGLIL
jgi:hypothetical protein